SAAGSAWGSAAASGTVVALASTLTGSFRPAGGRRPGRQHAPPTERHRRAPLVFRPRARGARRVSGNDVGRIAPGGRLGDLLLERELGRGNQGVVFEATQVSLGRRVAVKILAREIAAAPEQLDRFHREAEAAGRLSHPHIVAVYGFDDAHGHPLIVQELVTGGSLEKVLAERAQKKLGTN